MKLRRMRRGTSDKGLAHRCQIVLLAGRGRERSGIAEAVGVSPKSLRDWHKRLAPAPERCGEDASLDELLEEIKRLRKQLRRAELEREILKKATAYFARESQ